ncbi:MAG: hypothetical protein AVDCRST_MAG68-5122 [uncultured Gemmatimonadetes bacterium]|uniref:DUF4326 domain-containing protein n=1 Tax=uncultured Gemmatimonadota bacterium TaxID=203437 RepID=A0A6J4MS52_9BACT|nr:MAG: hypothetical protein AVDCRST_MAG68-5122 [uncultured Gemmatimonadota bacterium]
MPAGAIYVGRGTRWGNPYKASPLPSSSSWQVADVHQRQHGVYRDRRDAYAAAVELYRARVVVAPPRWEQLAGADLACWCPLTDEAGGRWPCHADELLRLSNPGWTP